MNIFVRKNVFRKDASLERMHSLGKMHSGRMHPSGGPSKKNPSENLQKL